MNIADDVTRSLDSLLPKGLQGTFNYPAMLLTFLLLVAMNIWLKPKGPLMKKGSPTLDGQWQKFELIKKTEVSPNTAMYRFALPSDKHYLGLPIGQHIQVQATIDNKAVQRSYTPISSDDDYGYFELMIKSYPQGNISKYIGELKEGDKIDVKGPRGQMKYEPGYADSIGMLAGGTGITPMLQVLRAIHKNPRDHTKVSLLYANVTEKDILLKDELDRIAQASDGQINVHYVLDKPPENWKGSTGFISKELIEDKVDGPTKQSKVHLCGPPPMIKALKGHLEALKFDKPNPISKMPDQVFCY